VSLHSLQPAGSSSFSSVGSHRRDCGTPLTQPKSFSSRVHPARASKHIETSSSSATCSSQRSPRVLVVRRGHRSREHATHALASSVTFDVRCCNTPKGPSSLHLCLGCEREDASVRRALHICAILLESVFIFANIHTHTNWFLTSRFINSLNYLSQNDSS
jgi:hypothetical protein